MKIVFFFLLAFLVACTGTSNSVQSSHSGMAPQRIDLMDTILTVVGNLPDGVSPKDFQVVAYQTKTAKRIVSYRFVLDQEYRVPENGIRKEGEFFSYKVYIDGNAPADEIVWYNKGVAYQTLEIEYFVKSGEIVSVQALWNGKRSLCVNDYISYDKRKIVHMPDSRLPESDRYTVYYDDPKCRETEKFKEPSY